MSLKDTFVCVKETYVCVNVCVKEPMCTWKLDVCYVKDTYVYVQVCVKETYLCVKET